jgi:hypothetical protein
VLRALSEPIKAGFGQFDFVRLCAGKFRENLECRSTLWNKGGIDGRTRRNDHTEAVIKISFRGSLR